jgi:hypothetical protein
MNVIKNEGYSETIKDNLKKTRNPFDNGIMCLQFSDVDYYIWGGFVRDSLIKHFHNTNLKPSDIDYLVDTETGRGKKFYSNHPFSKRFEDWTFCDQTKKNICTIWFCLEPFDFGSLDFNKKMLINANAPRGLEHNLSSCDLNTSAIAYSPKKDEFYDCGAINAIKKREVDLLWTKDNKPIDTLSRLVSHAHKLNFDIGQRGINYIKEKYSNELDSKIIHYLTCRSKANLIEPVLSKLKKIK